MQESQAVKTNPFPHSNSYGHFRDKSWCMLKFVAKTKIESATGT